MPVPIMVRLDDDVAVKVRAHAYVKRRSVNRIINEIVLLHFANAPTDAIGPITNDVRTRIRELINDARTTVRPPVTTSHALQEQLRQAISAITDALDLLVVDEPMIETDTVG